MKFLLTNDDGLSSPGLTTLVYELQRTGRYDLRVVAPEKEQSGVGHCITIHWPLYAEKVTLPDPVTEAAAIRAAAGQCLKRVDLSRRLRLLGVRAGALLPMRELAAIGAARRLAAERQAPLF